MKWLRNSSFCSLNLIQPIIMSPHSERHHSLYYLIINYSQQEYLKLELPNLCWMYATKAKDGSDRSHLDISHSHLESDDSGLSLELKYQISFCCGDMVNHVPVQTLSMSDFYFSMCRYCDWSWMAWRCFLANEIKNSTDLLHIKQSSR